jgi:hypothetical protein
LLGRVLPLQVEDPDKDVDITYRAFEEINRELRELGLPVERIYPMLEYPKLGQDVANKDGP